VTMTAGQPPEERPSLSEQAVHRLRTERGLSVPAADEPLLEAYWQKMRGLRAQVDEDQLADAEIAVTWTATGEDRR
jgi:hypothetical protein